MKKFILTFTAIALFSTVSAEANCPYITQPCKKVVQTVCSDYFSDYEEWLEFCAELDFIYCGTIYNGNPHAEKQPDTPIPAIP